MTEAAQRIPPCPRERWTDEARDVFAFWGEPDAWENGSKTSILMVMGNHPPLGNVYNQWGKHFLMNNSLSTRQLELVILRVSWRVRSAYEWHNHVGYALNAGLSLDDIAAIRDYPNGGAWSAEEDAMIHAVDELIDANVVSDATWAILARTLRHEQLMDLVFTIGHYVMTSWALSSFGVPVEAGADVIGFDLRTRSGRVPGRTFKPGEAENWAETRGY